MKLAARLPLFQGFAAVCLSLAPAVGGLSAGDPIRIMRVGDSITWQKSGDATLQNLLDAAGVDYEFVGTQNWYDDGGYVPLELAREENQDVEGYPGMTVQWFTDPNFFWQSWLARPTTIQRGGGNTPIKHALTNNDTPDIILLMIGTNNMLRDINGVRGVDSSTEIDAFTLGVYFSALLLDIRELAPDAHVIVAELPVSNDTGGGGRTNQAGRTLNYNEQVVRPTTQNRIDAGDPLSLVDFYPLLDVPDDFYDDGSASRDYVHPGVTGIPKLSEAWFHAIMDVIQPPRPPSGFEDWMQGFAGLGPGDLAPSASPSGDGVPNLVKYFIDGLSPLSSDRNALPRPRFEEGFFHYEIPLRGGVNGVEGAFERFMAGAWETVANGVVLEEDTLSLALPLEDGPLLIRFRVREMP